MTPAEAEDEPDDRPRLTATTIRWDRVTYEYVRAEARNAGITVSQFVREAAIIRAAVRQVGRDAPGVPRDFQHLAEEVERRAAVRGNHTSGK